MFYLGTFEMEFENTSIILEICVVEFVLLQGFDAKIKILKIETKNARFGHFWAGI